jgi:hypothetical protein
MNLLARWQALDKELLAGTLHLKDFAERLEVDVKTIRRDLALFGVFGYLAEWGSHTGWRWRYPPGERPMFTHSEIAAERDRKTKKAPPSP